MKQQKAVSRNISSRHSNRRFDPADAPAFMADVQRSMCIGFAAEKRVLESKSFSANRFNAPVYSSPNISSRPVEVVAGIHHVGYGGVDTSQSQTGEIREKVFA